MKLATLENALGVICLVSVEEGVGKTTVCAGLAKVLCGEGKSVGYLNPLSSSTEAVNRDAEFMKEITAEGAADAGQEDLGRDVVIMEALAGETAEDILSQRTYGAVREMQAKVVCVEAYCGSGEIRYADVYRGFGENLLGVVVNRVPVKLLADVCRKMKESLNTGGLNLLGCLPESRSLMAVTVGELAEQLNGTIMNNREKESEPVENFMMGALVVGSGADYFNRMDRKAAIIRQDRPDMQLAALETPSSCLVIGGHGKPIYNVLHKARAKKVPVIATDLGLGDIAEKLDEILLHSSVAQEQKVACAATIIRSNLDITGLTAG